MKKSLKKKLAFGLMAFLSAALFLPLSLAPEESQGYPYPRPLRAQALAQESQKDGPYYQNGWLIWEELVPSDWDPGKIFQELQLDTMADDDPRADEAVKKFTEMWNQAPINPKISGRSIKIPGFLVPLDFESRQIEEFFLVPYFGACIHSPPPPPNQIIYVKAQNPAKGLEAMDVVWVSGTITAERYSSEDLGQAGYSLSAEDVEPYRD
jgi:hypothetical protein